MFSSNVDNLVCRPKPADIINLDEDDSVHFASLPEYRLQSAPASLRKRSLTTSEQDDDLEILGENLVEGTNREL